MALNRIFFPLEPSSTMLLGGVECGSPFPPGQLLGFGR